MTPAEALEIVVARTLHVRYRELCDPAHPDYHPGCPELMLRLAGGMPDTPPSRVPLAVMTAALTAATGCPFRTRRGCGCQPDRCAAGCNGGDASLDSCRACLGPDGMWARLFPAQ